MLILVLTPFTIIQLSDSRSQDLKTLWATRQAFMCSSLRTYCQLLTYKYGMSIFLAWQCVLLYFLHVAWLPLLLRYTNCNVFAGSNYCKCMYYCSGQILPQHFRIAIEKRKSAGKLLTFPLKSRTTEDMSLFNVHACRGIPSLSVDSIILL